MTKLKTDIAHLCAHLNQYGLHTAETLALRKVEMALHRWHEKECGIDNGCIERDETTGKPYWLDSRTMQRRPIADVEANALKKLREIMARHPHLVAYVQGDPRGCALYIVRKDDIGPGEKIDSLYTRGIPVCT